VRLSSLTHEALGISARELIEGLKLDRVRKALGERIRIAARELWGAPGDYVWTKFEQALPGQSKYFRRGETVYNEERGDEIDRRSRELLVHLRRDFDLHAWAVELGFASVARLNRVCLNVLGKTFRQTQESLVAEVLR